MLLLSLPAAASADFPLTIETEGTGTGTVECVVGAGPVEACDSEYPEGTELILIPEADLGSEFIEWSGACGPLACELTMDQKHTAIATFDLEPGAVMFELAVKKTGSGTGTLQCEAESSPPGTCQATYPEGTEVTVLAEADPGSKFTGFSGDCSGQGCELTMDDDKSVTANFDPEPVSEFALTIVKVGTGTGTVLCEAQEGPQACQAKYPEGTEVTLLPTANSGSEFAGFSGDCTGASCALIMDKAHSVTATFNLEVGPEEFFALTITNAGTGTGTVKCKADGGEAETCEPEYEAGTELSLIATGNPGSTFVKYSAGTGSAASCSGSSCNFTISADSSVTATFDLEAGPKEFALTIITDAGTGSGTVMCEVDEGVEEDCDSKYPEGTELTLLAEPDPGSNFVGWSGNCSGSGTCKLTMNGARSVTATFDLEPVVEFTLTIVLKGTGSGAVLCEAQEGPEACKAKYPEDTELTLLPTANSGSKFTGFSGACSGLTCEVTMSANRTVNVTFDAIPKFTLKVKKTGTGTGKVTSSPAGIDCGLDCEEAYEEGKEVTLSATADAGSEFVKWSGACAASPCKVTMNAAKEVTAEFKLAAAKPKFTLKVKKTGTGTGKVTSSPAGIDCGLDCEEAFEEGKVVTLTQHADPGSEFVKWRGACFGTETCKVTMDAAKEVTAEFKSAPQPKFTLTVEKTGTGTGKVTSSPAGIDCGSDCEEAYEEGKEVTLTALAGEGSIFVHWTGGGCTGTEPCVVTMSGAKKVKAVFNAVGQRTLTVVKAGSGSGTVTSAPKGIDCGATCTASFNVGKKVTLIPVAATNSTFTGFSGACAGTTPCVVTMSEARSVTATFEVDPESQPPVGLVVVAGTAKAKSGKALLRIFCNGPSACEGELKLLLRVAPKRSVVIGKASFNLQPGASTTLKLPLSRRALAALENRKALQARVVGTGIHAHVVRLKNVL